jgi:phosphate starvation-inducible protein PhoH and related proteins
MPKHTRFEKHERKKQKASLLQSEGPLPVYDYSPKTCPQISSFTPLTLSQKAYLSLIERCTLSIALGCAGTGKSYVSVYAALRALLAKEIDQIIVSRPAVSAGESMGFLPGDVDEKFAPYLAPIRDILYDLVGKGQADYLVKAEKIKAIPIGFLRGHSFKKSFILIDEAQNCTPEQMKMILTRVGEDSKIIIEGDIAQSDLRTNSGLKDVAERFKNVPEAGVIEFSTDDIVRSGFCKSVVLAYQYG